MHSAEIAATLRQRGFRLTAPRWAIIRCLDGNDRHPTAQDVHEALLPDYPGLSLATVYHTLSVLEEIGAISGMKSGPEGRRFDANPEPHVNLVCRECGTVIDVSADQLAPLLHSAANGVAFSVHEMIVEAHGTCRECGRRQATLSSENVGQTGRREAPEQEASA